MGSCGTFKWVDSTPQHPVWHIVLSFCCAAFLQIVGRRGIVVSHHFNRHNLDIRGQKGPANLNPQAHRGEMLYKAPESDLAHDDAARLNQIISLTPFAAKLAA